jgi:hypothetical protein
MNSIIDPTTLQSYSIFSDYGKQLLKQFIKLYQSGGNSEESVVEESEEELKKPELRRASSKTSIDYGDGDGGSKEQVRTSYGTKVGELDKELNILERLINGKTQKVSVPNNCCTFVLFFEEIYTVDEKEYNTDIFSPPLSFTSFKNNHATSKTQSANYSMGAFNTFDESGEPLNDARILIECRKCGVQQSTLDNFIEKVSKLQNALTCNYTIGFEFELSVAIPKRFLNVNDAPKKMQKYIEIAQAEKDKKQPQLSEHVSAVKFDYEKGTHFEFVSNIIEVPAKISDTGGGTKGKSQTRTSKRKKTGKIILNEDVKNFQNDLNTILTEIYSNASHREGTGQVTFGVKLEDMHTFFNDFSTLGSKYQRDVPNWEAINPNWANDWLEIFIPESKRKKLFLKEETAIYGFFCLIIHYFVTFSAFTVFEGNTGMKGSPDLMIRNRFCDMYKLLSKEEQGLFKEIMSHIKIKGSETYKTYMYIFMNSAVDCGYFKCTLYEWLQTIVNPKLSTEFLNIYNTTLNIANIDCVMKESDKIIKKLRTVNKFENMQKSFNTPNVTKLLNIISKLKDIYQKSIVKGSMQTLEREDLQYIREDLTTVLFIPKGVEMPPIHEEGYGKKITIDAEFILIFLVFSLYYTFTVFFEIAKGGQWPQGKFSVVDWDEIQQIHEICNKILDGQPYDKWNNIKYTLFAIFLIIRDTGANTELKPFNADEYLFTNLPELSLESQKEAIKANRAVNAEAEALAAKLGGITPESLDTSSTVEYVEADAD